MSTAAGWRCDRKAGRRFRFSQANELKKSSASTAAVAEAVGYQSEAAFQRVFKLRMGMTPARWRRATRAPDPSTA